MKDKIKQNMSRSDVWLRGLFMLLFAIIYSIAELVIAFVAVFQFLTQLVTGRTNEKLLGFGQSLSVFVYQVMRYLTFNSEEKPFPFGDWPGQAGVEKDMSSTAALDDDIDDKPDEHSEVR